MELKTFREALFLISKFFNDLFFVFLVFFGWLKIKTKFEIITVTFHPKLFADENFDIADKERCNLLSCFYALSFKNNVDLNVILKYTNVIIK